MLHRFNKAKAGQQFLADCRKSKDFVSETEKTITVNIPVTPEQEHMLKSGQISKASLIKNYYPL